MRAVPGQATIYSICGEWMEIVYFIRICPGSDRAVCLADAARLKGPAPAWVHRCISRLCSFAMPLLRVHGPFLSGIRRVEACVQLLSTSLFLQDSSLGPDSMCCCREWEQGLRPDSFEHFEHVEHQVHCAVQGFRFAARAVLSCRRRGQGLPDIVI